MSAERPWFSTGRSPAVVAAMTFGTQFAVAMLVFAGGGWWLDRKRGGGVALTLCGVFLALVYGGYEVWKIVRALQRETPAPGAKR